MVVTGCGRAATCGGVVVTGGSVAISPRERTFSVVPTTNRYARRLEDPPMPGRPVVLALAMTSAFAAACLAAPRPSASTGIAATRAAAETLFRAGEFASAD